MDRIIPIFFVTNSKDYFITPESYILSFFTIIGILVTLVSISTSLTKQIRQDLITNYILKRKFIYFYIFYLIINLILSISFFYIDYNKSILLFGYVLMIIYTFIFASIFILTLNRNTLYKEISLNYKKELKNKHKQKEINKTRIHTQFESLDALVKNISFIQKNDTDFIEEIKTIKELFIFSINNKKENLFIDFYNDIVKRIDNPKFVSQMISLLYELKYTYFKNLRIIRLLQNLLYNLLVNQFSKTKEFDRTLNTSSLYLKEFMDIRYREDFIKCDINDISQFEVIFNNTINKVSELCEFILKLNLDNKIKFDYFNEQLSNLNKLFEEYKHITEIEFNSDYYSLKTKKDKSKEEKDLIILVDKKIKIIKEQKNNVKKKELDIFYLILYYIDNDYLNKKFFEIVIKLYNSNNFKNIYYNLYVPFNSKLDTFNYDWFNGGAQWIAQFNNIRYNLIISFFNYIKYDKLDFEEFSKEFFGEHNKYKFKDEVNNLNIDFLKKFIYFEDKKLKEFQKKSIQEIKKQKKNYKNNKDKYIIETPIKEEFRNKFKDDCKELWKELQEYLGKIFVIEYEDNSNNEIKEFFGIHKLFEKKWFIDDAPDENIVYARSTGNMIGRDITHSKKINILNKIDKLFDTSKKDKEIIVDDLYTNIKDNIESGGEYYFFHNSKINIYDLPNINWIRDSNWERAQTKINNSIIHIFFIHSNNTIMFKKNDFKLIQYNQGYEDRNEKLIADVEELNEEEVQKIKNSNENNWNTDEEVKRYVKIRVAEKFKIERKDNVKIIRFVN